MVQPRCRPEGFGDLASAINAVLLALPVEALPEVRVIFGPEARG